MSDQQETNTAEVKEAVANTAEPVVEQEQKDESWGSWFGRVVRVVEDSTNKLGSTIQKFVEEEIDEVQEKIVTDGEQSGEQPAPETSENAETQPPVSEEQGVRQIYCVLTVIGHTKIVRIS